MLVDPQTRPIQKGRTSKKLEMKSSTCPQNADNCPGTTYFKEEVTPADTIRFTNFVQRDKPWTYTSTVLQLWDTLWTTVFGRTYPEGSPRPGSLRTPPPVLATRWNLQGRKFMRHFTRQQLPEASPKISFMAYLQGRKFMRKAHHLEDQGRD